MRTNTGVGGQGSAAFASLAAEKRERVLNAALKEFARKDFASASTNAIVREAGISKGLLFHYFSTKRELFLFLLDHSLLVLKSELMDKIDSEEKDIFSRYREHALLKIELAFRHPWLFDFVRNAVTANSEEVKDEVEKRINDIRTISSGKMRENLDTEQFRAGIDPAKAMNIIAWSFEGFAKSVEEDAKSLRVSEFNYAEIFKEFDDYIDILRKSLLK